MPTAALPIPAQNFVMRNIPWTTYVAIGDLLLDQNIRMNYDRGVLEFMMTSPQHEHQKTLLGRLVETLTEELNVDIASFGSMTFRQEDAERGMEPDECYWIEHEEQVRGRTTIDFDADPPPDLVVEIEVSRSIVPRLPILAALRVPEVWCWDGERVRVLLLTADGSHTESPTSRVFPFLPMTELPRFLADQGQSETKVVRAFRAWVREQIASGAWPKLGA